MKYTNYPKKTKTFLEKAPQPQATGSALTPKNQVLKRAAICTAPSSEQTLLPKLYWWRPGLCWVHLFLKPYHEKICPASDIFKLQ
jgi:hypothetical protein